MSFEQDGFASNEQSPKRQRVAASEIEFLPADQLQTAHTKKWIDEWELNFYTENRESESLSDKQVEIKNRIESKIAKCAESSGPIEAAFKAGKINSWEHNFLMENLSRDTLSDKQMEIKQRIEVKIAGGAAEAVAPVPTENLTAQMIDLIEEAATNGAITSWERATIFDMYAKEATGLLSDKQLALKQNIEQKIAAGPPQTPEVSEYFGISKEALKAARASNLISDWELNFAMDNFAKPSLSEKQTAIVERIKGKLSGVSVASAPAAVSSVDTGKIDEALKEGKINSWEHKFYLENVQKASLSDKQAKIKEQIEAKLARIARPRPASDHRVVTRRVSSDQ